jgi:hypothetical protein
MTINQLIKKLQKLEKECPRNTHVTVDWQELKNDDYTYSPVKDLSLEYANLADGDGYSMYRKDGQEVMRHFLVLK